MLVTIPTAWDQLLGGNPEGATADAQVALTLAASIPPADAKAGAVIDPGICRSGVEDPGFN